MNEIFEDVKDMGVLIGKGGIYGQVTILRFVFGHPLLLCVEKQLRACSAI